MRPVRPNNDLERYADILDVAVVNLEQAGKGEELQNGYMYTEVLKIEYWAYHSLQKVDSRKQES